MEIIKVPNQSYFENYDNQVREGTLLNYNSKKPKSALRKDSENHFYKVYERHINSGQRIGRIIAVVLSCLIVMPLWSKKCRRLWSEGSTGKEKVKIVSIDQPDCELAKAINLISKCVKRIFSSESDVAPSSLSIFLHLGIGSKIINKQFLFNKNIDPLNSSDIDQKIKNYLENELFKGETLSEAPSYECHVMGVAFQQNKSSLREWDNSISYQKSGLKVKGTSGDGSVNTGKSALVHSTTWLKSNMPFVSKLFEKVEFIKIDDIFQPL